MQTGTIEQRNEKILFVQQQMNGLQAYGAYGYEVLEALRERIKLVPVVIQERWREGAFEFVYQGKTVCVFHWQGEDSISIVLYDKVQDKLLPVEHEYTKGKKIAWAVITGSIHHYIRELQSSEVMIQ